MRGPVKITPASLRRWKLPEPSSGGDKDSRGQVLIVGGSTEMPGAVLLAATAALRAGAGKLQVATVKSVAALVAAAVPEALVMGISPKVADAANQANAVLFGPGMTESTKLVNWLSKILRRLEKPVVVLDAGALTSLAGRPRVVAGLRGRVILTPHAGELATLMDADRKRIEREPDVWAAKAAKEWRAIVALKGPETFIAAPNGDLYLHAAKNAGLATSGSGDTLAGIIAGLAARGAAPVQAAAWGVALHAGAGARLAKRMGKLGFLARELLAEVPPLMHSLS